MADETQQSPAVGGSNISSARELQAGDYLGHYRIEQKLGEGGMGAVYKAHEEALGRFVAIKVLSRRVVADEQFAQRFLVEARAVAALDHPNIIQIYFVGQQEGLLFFAMQFVDGCTLESLLEQRKQLFPQEAVGAILYAALGLQHAQAHGVIHRDIKPANLMVTQDGLIKIADFGLAKRVTTDPAFSAHLTGTHVIMGTPNYISPEQARGLPADHRSDIYSLGCTLYNLLAGRPPFLGETAMDIMLHHIQTPPLPIQQSAPDVPEALNPILAMMLAKDPNARYQTYDDLIADLNAFPTGQTPAAAAQLVLSSAPSPPMRAQTVPIELVGSARPPPCKFRTAIYAGALIFIVTGLLIWSLWDSFRSPRERNLQSSAPQTSTTSTSPQSPSSSPRVEGAVDNPARWKDAINLLPRIDPKKDAVKGDWQIENGALTSDATRDARIELPYRPPEEYDFRIVFSRLDGKDTVLQILSKGGQLFTWNMGDKANALFGFETVNGQTVDQNSTGRRAESCLENGRRYASIVQVRKDGVKAYLDGNLISECPIDGNKLKAFFSWELRDKRLLGLGSWQNPVAFYEIQVLELSGKGAFTRPDDHAAKGAETAHRARKAAATENVDDFARWKDAINLLSLIDPRKDGVKGDCSWKKLHPWWARTRIRAYRPL